MQTKGATFFVDRHQSGGPKSEGFVSHSSALSGFAIGQGWFSIYAASVLSLETAVNGKISIKDQDYEVELVSNKFVITEETVTAFILMSPQFEICCEKYR